VVELRWRGLDGWVVVLCWPDPTSYHPRIRVSGADGGLEQWIYRMTTV
jgi:hypothetical protein